MRSCPLRTSVDRRSPSKGCTERFLDHCAVAACPLGCLTAASLGKWRCHRDDHEPWRRDPGHLILSSAASRLRSLTRGTGFPHRCRLCPLPPPAAHSPVLARGLALCFNRFQCLLASPREGRVIANSAGDLACAASHGADLRLVQHKHSVPVDLAQGRTDLQGALPHQERKAAFLPSLLPRGAKACVPEVSGKSAQPGPSHPGSREPPWPPGSPWG